jgi:hypothetical protein
LSIPTEKDSGMGLSIPTNKESGMGLSITPPPFALSLSKGSPERSEGASPSVQQKASTSLSPNGLGPTA